MLTIRFQGPAEAVEKLKGSQDKIKSKVLAKLPSAHSAQVILRDKPVNASSGAFYGGFIYGEDKEGKKVKCGEVRVKTASLGKVTPSKEVKKVEKTQDPTEKENLQNIKSTIDEIIRKQEVRAEGFSKSYIKVTENLGSSIKRVGSEYTYVKESVYEVLMPNSIRPGGRRSYIPSMLDTRIFFDAVRSMHEVKRLFGLSVLRDKYKCACRDIQKIGAVLYTVKVKLTIVFSENVR